MPVGVTSGVVAGAIGRRHRHAAGGWTNGTRGMERQPPPPASRPACVELSREWASQSALGTPHPAARQNRAPARSLAEERPRKARGVTQCSEISGGKNELEQRKKGCVPGQRRASRGALRGRDARKQRWVVFRRDRREGVPSPRQVAARRKWPATLHVQLSGAQRRAPPGGGQHAEGSALTRQPSSCGSALASAQHITHVSRRGQSQELTWTGRALLQRRPPSPAKWRRAAELMLCFPPLPPVQPRGCWAPAR